MPKKSISKETFTFTVIYAKPMKSKAGNDMFLVKLKDIENDDHIIFDYLLFPEPTKKMQGLINKTNLFLKCMGEKIQSPLKITDYNSANWAFNEIKANLKQEEWNGEWQDRINNYVYDKTLNRIESLPIDKECTPCDGSSEEAYLPF